MRAPILRATATALGILGGVWGGVAQADPGGAPPDLSAVQADVAPARDAEIGSFRRTALREAAVSHGMASGLARRTWEIQAEVRRRAGDFDRIYDFRRVVLPGPKGLLLEPPVIVEGDDAINITDDGQRVAFARKHYAKISDSRYVLTVRDWAQYLVYDADPVRPIHHQLLPAGGEREEWRKWVAEGWTQGVQQAEDVYAVRRAELDRDLIGMALGRQLMGEQLLSPAHPLVTEKGVTGDGNELRIGDSEVEIRERSLLQPKPERWRALPFVGSTPP